MTDLHDLSLSDVCRRMKSGELSAVRVTEHTLTRIAALDPTLCSFVTVTRERALATAARLDGERAAGKPLGALHGVPIALKDLLSTAGVRTTCGTRVLRDWVPDEDATVVAKLERAGAVVVGKVKLTEGAYSAHHPDVPAPRNPWNARHWTGVSSSGSGVSVAGRLAYGAIGTDTGGSIRFPSAACGVVGFKPTYGRVSRHGAFPLADSLDHVGPMTRTVEDAARMLTVMAGWDAKDPTSLREPVPNYVAACTPDLAGLRIGVDRAYVETGVTADVVATVRAALESFRSLGVAVREVQLPPYANLVRGWAVTCGVETALAHARFFPARRADYGPELAGLIETGRGAAATAYATLEREREAFRAGLDRLFDDVDAIIAPCMVSAAPSLESMAAVVASRTQTVDFITFTAPFDYSGHPSLTLPAALDGAGLPLAFQLVGRRLGEETLLHMGHAWEQARGAFSYPS
jgi:amidase